MDNSYVISVNNLTKYFENVKAVDGVSFDVNEGEIFGLLGPNGAGKTTIIKLLLGLLEPRSGKINILGFDPNRDSMKIKSKIGYVAEEPLMFKSLSIKNLFDFIASIRRINDEYTREMFKKYLSSYELSGYYNSFIEGLSHGNKQKLQFIASILHKPDLLILDEPFAGLDPKSVKVTREILNMHVESGGSIFFSTHILKVAENLCDRIAIINKGKIEAVGTLEELRDLAKAAGANLEEVFLKITKETGSINNFLKKLKQNELGL